MAFTMVDESKHILNVSLFREKVDMLEGKLQRGTPVVLNGCNVGTWAGCTAVLNGTCYGVEGSPQADTTVTVGLGGTTFASRFPLCISPAPVTVSSPKMNNRTATAERALQLVAVDRLRHRRGAVREAHELAGVLGAPGDRGLHL